MTSNFTVRASLAFEEEIPDIGNQIPRRSRSNGSRGARLYGGTVWDGNFWGRGKKQIVLEVRIMKERKKNARSA
jgi:hypothetical protein